MTVVDALEDHLIRLLASLNVCHGSLLIEHHPNRCWTVSLIVDGAPARYGEGEDAGTAILQLTQAN